MTMTLIETKTLGSAQANIEFTSIPQDGTDLIVLLSDRMATANDTSIYIEFNGSTTGYNMTRLGGTGSSIFSQAFSEQIAASGQNANFTANTFGNDSIYIPNYTSSTSKTWSSDCVTENNATGAYSQIIAGLWSGTSAITSLLLKINGGSNLAAGTTVSLYKITKGSSGGVTVS